MNKLFTFIFLCSLITASVVNAQIIKDSVIFFLPFDSTIADVSGKNIVFTQDLGTSLVYEENGKFGGAIKFKGSRIISLDSMFNSYETFSFTTWIKLAALPAAGKGYTIIHQIDDPNNNLGRVHLQILKDIYAIQSGTGGDTGGNHNITDSVAVEIERWYHVAMVWDRENLKKTVYIDGVKIGELDIVSPEVCFGALTIGAAKNKGAAFNGYMDDLLYTKQVLSEQDIKDIMTNGVAVTLGISTKMNKQLTNSLKVLPNPSNGIFQVELNGQTGSLPYHVFDIKGQQVVAGTLVSGGTIDLSGLNKGIYILNYLENSMPATHKLIIK